MSAGLYGILARFDTPAGLLSAASAARDAGYRRFDTFTPFPVHGMERAMGLCDTRLPWIALAMGAVGLAAATGLQGWAMGVAYPMITGGKPLFSLPAFVPIMFELTVLFAAFGSAFGMLWLNRLPALYHPLFKSKEFARVTRDGFFLAIESADPKFDTAGVREFFRARGAKTVEEIYE